MKECRKAERILYSFFGGIALYICSIFCFNGIHSRVLIDINEKAYLINISPVLVVGGMICIIGVFVFLWRIADKLIVQPRFIFIISISISIFWVLMSQNVPSNDAGYCFKIAAELGDGINYSFEPGQYLDVCHQQYALVELIYALSRIGGQYNYLLFQIVNSIVFSFMCYETYVFIQEKSHKLALVTFTFLALYFPIWLFNTYCYGNMLSTSLGIIAIIRQAYFFKTRKWRMAIEANVFMALAIVIKMYALIYLIAMIMMYIFDSIYRKQYKGLVYSLVALAIYFGINAGVNAEMQILSRGNIRGGQGYSLLGTIVMGLDINEEQSNPGWYTGKNVSIYYKSDFDRNKASEMSKDELLTIFERITHEPKVFIRTMLTKNQTIWNEPTFDIMYRNRITTESNLRSHSRWYMDFMADSGRLHRIAILFVGCLQITIYLGTILYVVISTDRSLNKIVGLIIFIGGVLFLMFWEGKSEYAMQFFLPLVYYAAEGYLIFADRVAGIICKTQKKMKFNATDIRRSLGVTFIMVLAGSTLLICRTERNDEAKWNKYIDEHYYFSPGNYNIVAKYSDETLVDNVYIDFELLNSEWVYEFYNNTERYYFRFLNWDDIDLVNVNRMAREEDYYIQMTTDYDQGKDVEYHWKIQRKNGGYLIRSYENPNMVWTYDSQKTKIRLEDYQENNRKQIWKLSRD